MRAKGMVSCITDELCRQDYSRSNAMELRIPDDTFPVEKSALMSSSKFNFSMGKIKQIIDFRLLWSPYGLNE